MAEVAWAIQANHGGGYQYRLCKKSEKPTEECFQVSARLQTKVCVAAGCVSNMCALCGAADAARVRRLHDHDPHGEPPVAARLRDPRDGHHHRHFPSRLSLASQPSKCSRCLCGFFRRSSKKAAAQIPACNCDLGEEAGPTQCGSGLGDGTVPYEIDPEAPTKTPRCPTGVQFPPAWPEGYGYGSEYHAPGSEKPVDPHSPGKPTCAPAIYKACGSGRGPTMKTCEACIAEHQAELTAAGCTRTMAEGFCAQAASTSFYSLQDNVRVPEEKGEFLLSFRWVS